MLDAEVTASNPERMHRNLSAAYHEIVRSVIASCVKYAPEERREAVVGPFTVPSRRWALVLSADFSLMSTCTRRAKANAERSSAADPKIMGNSRGTGLRDGTVTE
jgi:hypothetical protein